jgi:hypothetical protein
MVKQKQPLQTLLLLDTGNSTENQLIAELDQAVLWLAKTV